LVDSLSRGRGAFFGCATDLLFLLSLHPGQPSQQFFENCSVALAVGRCCCASESSQSVQREGHRQRDAATVGRPSRDTPVWRHARPAVARYSGEHDSPMIDLTPLDLNVWRRCDQARCSSEQVLGPLHILDSDDALALIRPDHYDPAAAIGHRSEQARDRTRVSDRRLEL
jgi:hypothetical protein